MTSKILKISFTKHAQCEPEVNIWNIFDIEHPPFMHGKRKHGDGMDPSAILFEKDNFNITLDTQRLPFLTFIKRQSIMFHYADIENNTVYQYSSFHGILIAQKYTAEICSDIKDQKDVLSKFDVNIAFHLEGWKIILSPLIRWYASKWLTQTWVEDLEMKERRQKFIDLGFQDMKGVPASLSQRIGKKQFLNLPLPRADEKMIDHPFAYKYLKKKEFFK